MTLAEVRRQLPQPLGLPRHSVRAILALLLCGSLWYLAIKEQPAPDILWESVLLVVAFYFGVRSTAPIATIPLATAGGAVDHARAPQPLFLPRGSVRTVLLLGFFGIVAFDWFKGRALPETMVLVLQVLTSYITGYVLSSFLIRRAQRGAKPIRGLTIFRHLLAVASLGVVGAVCGSILFGAPSWMPAIPDQVLAWTVAFYFGSRLSP